MQLPGGAEAKLAERHAISGMTLWVGEANGFKVQWLTHDWELALYVLAVAWPIGPFHRFEGVTLIDKEGIQYGLTGRSA